MRQTQNSNLRGGIHFLFTHVTHLKSPISYILTCQIYLPMTKCFSLFRSHLRRCQSLTVGSKQTTRLSPWALVKKQRCRLAGSLNAGLVTNAFFLLLIFTLTLMQSIDILRLAKYVVRIAQQWQRSASNPARVFNEGNNL